MKTGALKESRRRRRKAGIRKRIFGTPEQPRLTVSRSLNHIYVQIIDDLAGKTLASAGSLGGKNEKDAKGNSSVAAQIGKVVAEKAKAAGITKVAFDRNGYRYHGRVKALADAAREGGLEF